MTGSSSKKGKNKRPFDLTGLEDDQYFTPNDENADSYASHVTYDDGAPPIGDEPLGDFDDSAAFDEHIEQSIEQDDSNIEGEQGALIDPEPLNEAVEQPTPVSSEEPRKSASVAQMGDPDESHNSVSAPAPTTGRRRGKSKHNKPEVYEDPHVESVAKPLKQRGAAASKKAPKERNPNARPKPAAKPTSKTLPVREGSAGPKGGTYLVQRSETPATDNGAVVTRSGRASYKPLASWRGEKAIYGQRPDWETPAPITDIIRTDEIQIAPQARRKPTRKAPAKSELEEIEEEPEDQDLDPWETETGIMHAQVMRWDQQAGKYDENDPEEAGTLLSNFVAVVPKLTDPLHRSGVRCPRH